MKSPLWLNQLSSIRTQRITRWQYARWSKPVNCGAISNIHLPLRLRSLHLQDVEVSPQSLPKLPSMRTNYAQSKSYSSWWAWALSMSQVVKMKLPSHATWTQSRIYSWSITTQIKLSLTAASVQSSTTLMNLPGPCDASWKLERFANYD